MKHISPATPAVPQPGCAKAATRAAEPTCRRTYSRNSNQGGDNAKFEHAPVIDSENPLTIGRRRLEAVMPATPAGQNRQVVQTGRRDGHLISPSHGSEG